MIPLSKKRPIVFYGWWIVSASFLIMLFTGGFITLGFTAFFEPIANAFGWSYAQVSLAASLRGIEVGLLAPILGLLVDRLGPRRLVFGGILLLGISLLVLSRINSIGMFYGGFALVAIGVSFASPTVFMSTVAYWFRKKVGIATGIVSSGFALGGLLVPVVVKLIDTFDWRMALFILGITIWAACLPLSIILRHKPDQYGYLPDGEESIVTAPDQVPILAETPEAVIGVKQALKSHTFWHISVAMMFSIMAISAVTIHIMPYLSSIGVPRSTASLVTMALPLASIAGRLGSGCLSDKFNKKAIASGFLAIMVLGLLCISYASGEMMWIIVFFIFVFGIGWGGNVTIRVTMMREYFGRSKFGSIFGFMMGMQALGTMLGPFFAGWVFDNWASYQTAWLTLTIIVFVSIIIIATTPPVTTGTKDHLKEVSSYDN